MIVSTQNALILPAALYGKRIGVFVDDFKDFAQSWNEIVQQYGLFGQGGIIKAKDETRKMIEFVGGGTLEVWSIGDEGRKDKGRGRKYHRVIYEETQKIPSHILEYHWQSVARPTLTDYKGDAWFIGTAAGKDNYWYKLCQRGGEGVERNFEGVLDLLPPEKPSKGWKTFRMTTLDNPFIDPNEVELARSDMDELTFLQEYMSVFVDYSGQAWVYVLRDNEAQKRVFTKSRPLRWGKEQMYISFDFNKIPMTAAVMVRNELTTREQEQSRYRYGVSIVKEFAVGSIQEGEASIYDTCQAIREWIFAETGKKVGLWDNKPFPFVFPVLVTGDASGNRSDGRQRVPATYYDIIQEQLCLTTQHFVIPKANPLHAESYVQVNTIISKNPKFHIWEDKCPNLRLDCLRIKGDNQRRIVKAKGAERQADLLDNLRYLLNTFCQDIKL
jgi:hypothetical protein